MFYYLKKELPALKAELDKITRRTYIKLKTLKRSCSTLTDQKVYLVELFTSVWDIFNIGINGNYKNAFFDSVNIKIVVENK